MRCPECQATLGSLDLERQKCPACGFSFASDFNDAAEGSATYASSDEDVNESGATYLSDETPAEDDPAVSGEDDASRGTNADQTYLSDEWPEHEGKGPEKTIGLDAFDPTKTSASTPDAPLATVQNTLDCGAAPRHTGDTSVDATFISDEWPEHEAVEPTRRTGDGEAPPSAVDSTGQTMTSNDFSNAGESGGFVVVTQGNSSRGSADESSQTMVSDAPHASEMRTLQSNFGDISGDQPAMTLKTVDPKAPTGDSARGTLETVPRRSMRGGETPQINRPDYELVKVLGEGGMGIVWTARQTSVDRSVAVKMIKGPAARSRTQRQKFLAEAIVTGDLDHPNIVPIYDVGSDDKGILFYSMKQVQGTPWLKVLKKKSLHENLEILLRTADAVAFAHARGIIHRDLKPENVMLGSFGEVLVMDWGLALPTAQFQKGRDVVTPGMGGTPAYMAPEMATGPIDRITFASDIYLLGAILFEMVTGKAPHPGKKVQECLLNAMRNVLSETDKTGELVDIAKKAMATHPVDRYPTVKDFQDAIRGYLSHSESIAMAVRAEEDLEAAKKTGDYTAFNKAVFGFEEALELWAENAQAAKGLSAARLAYAGAALDKGDFDLGLSLVKSNEPEHVALRGKLQEGLDERAARHRRLQAAKRVMGAMAAAIFLIVTVSFFWIQSERRVAIEQRDEAKKQEGIAKDQTLIATRERDNAQKQERIANEQRLLVVKERDNAKAQEKIASEQRDEAKRQEMIANEQKVIATKERDNAKMQEKLALEQKKLAEEQKAIATKERDNAKTQEQIALQQKKLADEQKAIATKERDNARMQEQIAVAQKKVADEQRTLALEAKEKEEYESYIAKIGLAAAKIDENAFDVAEALLVACPVELRNWEWGRLMHLCRQASRELQAGGPVDAVAVSPDGRRVAAGSWDNNARIWDLETGKLLLEIPHTGLYVHGVAWSPDGKTLATGGSAKGKYLNLWSAETGELLRTLPGHSDAVVSVTFYDNGQWLLSTSYDETARLWDLRDPAAPREAALLRDHTWWVWDAAFSPGFDPTSKGPGKTNGIVTGSQDGKVVISRVTAVQEVGSKEVRVEPTGVFTGHEGPVYCVAFDATGRNVASGGYDRRVLLWNPMEVPPTSFGDVEKRVEVKVRELAGHPAPVQSLSFSKDGALLLSGGRDNAVKVWSVEQAKAIKTLRGHNSAVRAVTWTPDGRTVVSGSQDQRVLLWGIDSYEEFRVLEGRTLAGHTDAILGASFSPSGKEILTASRDRTARSWDAATGHLHQTFREGHDYLASNAVFFRDGKTLVTAAADDTVRFWDVATGTQFLRLTGTGWSAAIDLSPDGRWLVTGSNDESVKLWDLRGLRRDDESGRSSTLPASGKLAGHNGRVTAVAFAPEGNVIVTADANGRCLMSRINEDGTTAPLWNVRHHTMRISAISFLPSGEILTASSDHTVSRLDPRTGQEIDGQILKHKTPVVAVAVSKDGSRIATISELHEATDAFKEGSRVTLFDAATSKALETLDFPDYSVTSIDFSKDGKGLLAACSDNRVRVLSPGSTHAVGPALIDFEARGGLVWSARFTDDFRSIVTVGGSDARLWDAATARESMTFSPHGAVASARFSPAGDKVVTGSWDNSAKIWSAKTGQALLKLEHGHTGYINATVFSPDGRQVLTASDDATCKLWDVRTGKVIHTLTGHKDRVRWATFSRDGSMILTSSNDKTARLWDAATGKQQGEPFVGHAWGVLCAQFSPDAKRIITGSEDNEAWVWEVATRQPLAKLKGHVASETSVAFSLDGLRAFTASQDNTAKLWDATPGREGKEILTLKGHSQEVTSVAFSPDGREVLTASRDGKAIVWLTTDWKGEPSPIATRGE